MQAMADGRALSEKSDEEKKAPAILEEQSRLDGLSTDDLQFLANFPAEERRKIIRKVDWRLMPVLLFLYLAAYIDKTNIGNAKIEGLQKSLKMKGSDYNVALALFFPSYILAEVPSNMILNRFKRPSLYIGLLVLGFGILMTCAGVVQSFAGLVVVRFLQGLFE